MELNEPRLLFAAVIVVIVEREREKKLDKGFLIGYLMCDGQQRGELSWH